MVNDKNNKLLTKKRKKVIKGIFLVKKNYINNDENKDLNNN